MQMNEKLVPLHDLTAEAGCGPTEAVGALQAAGVLVLHEAVNGIGLPHVLERDLPAARGALGLPETPAVAAVADEAPKEPTLAERVVAVGIPTDEEGRRALRVAHGFPPDLDEPEAEPVEQPAEVAGKE